MRNGIKKGLAVLLAFVMVVGLAPVGALAELDWPTLPDGRVSALIGSVRSATERLGGFLYGLSLRASAESVSGSCGAEGSAVLWSIDTESGALTVSGTGAMQDFNSFGSVPWYTYRASICSVTVENGVTAIGNYAFNGMTELTSMSIPDSVARIGSYAFSGCTGLTGISFGSGLTAVESYSFYGCASLTGLMFPDGLTEIGSYAFSGCSALTSIRIPDGVTDVSSYAFNGCTSLASVTLPDSLISIGSNAFSNCKALSAIIIPNGVTTVGSSAFYNCTNLASVTIPDSVTSIGGSVFYGTAWLNDESDWYDGMRYAGGILIAAKKNISGVCTIAEGTRFIANSAFQGCSNITKVIIPDSVETIGTGAFYGCTGLTDIMVGNGVTSIGVGAFRNCSSLVNLTIPFIGLSADAAGPEAVFGAIFGISNYETNAVMQYYAQYSYHNSSYYFIPASLRKVTLTEPLEKIPYGAFSNCSMLTEISLPDSLKHIGSYAFRGCSGLTSITIPENVEVVYPLIFKDCTALAEVTFNAVDCTTCDSEGYAWFSGCSALRSVVFGDSVTKIPANFLIGCSGITSLSLPATVSDIGDKAFLECSGITEITIPDSVNRIGIRAFYGCTALRDLDLGSCVSEIERYAFSYCSGLEHVTIPDSVTSIGDSAFAYCSGLESVSISQNLTRIGSYAFAYCSELERVTIPESVMSIGDYAFGYCAGLTHVDYNACNCTTDCSTNSYIKNSFLTGCDALRSVTIGEHVARIPDYAFYNCTGLESVTIPDSVTELCASALRGCTGLTTVTLGNGLQTIGDDVFRGCSALISLTIPENVTMIGSGAFQDCSSLESFTLYAKHCDAMSSESAPAFAGCPSLRNVLIGNAATFVPDYAFYNCTSLEKVEIGESVQKIGVKAFYGCSNLQSVFFRGEKTSVAYAAFDACSEYTVCCTEGSYWHAYAMSNGIRYALTDETAETVFEIKNQVLLGYSGAADKVTVPSSVTMIGFEAFSENDTVTRVAMTQSVTAVSNYAFADCANLSEVFIPDTVTSIGANAFIGSHPVIICIENSYAHRYAVSHNMTVRFVRILIDLENAVMRVEIPYADEPEVSLVHLTGVSLQVIGLGTLPNKTTYRVGEVFNPDGLSLAAHYSNGMTSILRDGFTVSQPIFSAPGEQTVTLDYCGQSVEFTVTVTDGVVSGDADGSGTLDLKDATLILRYIAGGWDVDLSEIDVDVNKDGTVDLKDAAILRRYLAGGWNVALA